MPAGGLRQHFRLDERDAAAEPDNTSTAVPRHAGMQNPFQDVFGHPTDQDWRRHGLLGPLLAESYAPVTGTDLLGVDWVSIGSIRAESC